MVDVECPSCKAIVNLSDQPKLSNVIVCTSCGGKLNVDSVDHLSVSSQKETI